MKKAVSLILVVMMLMLCLTGCGGEKDGNKIVVGASSTPHAEILESVKNVLAEQGYELSIKIYDDFVLPNTATEDEELDANYFQHTPYLESFNAENGTHLVSVGKIHYEPYGIYAGTCKSLAALPDGARIPVPNDPSNEGRALQLLAANGLIKLKENAGLTATKQDITENPHHYDIVEMEAALIPGVLDDCAVAVINGNYAIGAGLRVSQALAAESKDSEAAQTYANIVAVKEGRENDPGIKALVAALQSDAVKTFIVGKYDGSVVPSF